MDEAQLNAHLDAIRSPGRVNPQWKGIAEVMSGFAAFLAEIEREHAESAAKLGRQTDKLIGLTRVLVGLTLALFLLTVYLSYDAYWKERRLERRTQNTSAQS